MKPSVRSSLPTALLTFSAAAMIFFPYALSRETNAPGIVDLLSGRHPGGYWSVWAQLASDGTLTYRAGSRFPDQNWEFGEELRNPKKVPAPSRAKGERTAYITVATPRRHKFEERYVEQIRYAGEETASWQTIIDSPIVWWNGPGGCFDVYSRHSRLRVGSIGGDGAFVKAPAVPSTRFEPFMITGGVSGACFIATGSGVYLLDLPYGPLRPIFDGPIQGASYLLPTPPNEQYGFYNREHGAEDYEVVVESAGALLEMDVQGRVARRIPLPQESVGEEAEVTFFQNGRLVVRTNDPHEWWVHRLWLLESDGRVLRRLEYDSKQLELQMNKGVPYTPSFSAPTMLPPLPVWMTKAALAQSVIVSLLLTGIVLWHQTRVGRRGAKRIAWTLFAFVFGLLGAGTYLVAYRDYRTEPCPDCGRRRPVAADDCPHCRATWPAPKPIGSELRTLD